MTMLAWIHVYLVAFLGGWVLVVTLVTGWEPIVVTSGSMQPTLRPGDVLMIDDHPADFVGQRTVVTYADSDGELVTHRVFEVLRGQGEYITKGDANPTPDTDRIAPGEVVGVGRLVVPLVGLALVWGLQGNLAPLLAVIVLTMVSLYLTASSVLENRRERSNRAETQHVTVADQAIRRVRFLVAIMILSQYVLDAGRFEIERFPIGRLTMLALAVAGLLLINLASIGATVKSWDLARVRTIELIADTLLVLLLTTVTTGAGIGWVLVALPIVEAAVRFGLTGSLLHWIMMAASTMAIRLWILQDNTSNVNAVIDDLEQALDQLGVLLLVVIPGAYLAEQLLGDVVRQQDATDAALRKGELLGVVAEAGHQVNRMGVAVFDTLTASAAMLGFASADVCVRTPSGEWERFGAVGGLSLPSPGEPASTLASSDLDADVVTLGEEGHDQATLSALGFAAITRHTLIAGDQAVALRAGSPLGDTDHATRLEALGLLAAQARIALQNQQLVGQLETARDELHHQATHDALTGLENRAEFIRRLASVGDRAEGAAVLFLDLDGFKKVNDTMGHDAGDELLTVVAHRLRAATEQDGTVFRLGGDEFTILVQSATPASLDLLARRIHRALAEPLSFAGNRLTVGTSIGMALADTDTDADELLRRADVAMYAAKQHGDESRTATYHPGLDEDERRREHLARDFDQALTEGTLALAYQAIVTARTHQIVGAEVLIRWSHPSRGAVDAETILDVARSTGRSDELNAWIFDTALRDLRHLDEATATNLTIAINVSPEELGSDALVPNLQRAMRVRGVDGRRLMIELSERIVAERRGQIPNLDRLRRLGVDLSLDDFGEGKTSLAHLRDLPIQQLKLDRMLVEQASTSANDLVILRSIVSLAHELGFAVVAEGVEHAAQVRMLLESGADQLQGYGIHEPMPIDQFVSVVRAADRRVDLRTAA